MSLSAALDVAIGLIFTYLLLALLASAVREGFAGFFNLRAKGLRKSLAQLLAANDAAGQADSSIFDAVFGHSLIRGIFPKKQLPSYVPAQNFALALIDALADGSQSPLFTQIERGVARIPGGSVKQTMQAFVTEAAGDVDKLKTRITAWFDDAMDRLSGVYKRRSQAWMFAIGVVISASLNVDSINIATTLWNDPAKRDAIVAAAQKYESAQTTSADMQKAAKDVQDIVESLPLPIGWDDIIRKVECASAPTPAECKPVPPQALLDRLKLVGSAFWQALTAWTVIGWLITALAISFGAPFWFDALEDVLKMRAAGPKPPRADDPTNPQNASG